jgi:hypothetical protein
MIQDLKKAIEDAKNEPITNLTWNEDDGLWKGWRYSPEKNRYYFDDIGIESLTEFWADEFLNQAHERV